jgi:uncharacterized protein YabN with tetrapyrrole methylase and pyrophosphatase domain
MMPTFEELVENVIGWGAERSLHVADLRPQFVKLTEELGELAAGIARNNSSRIEDAVGDLLVVLVNFGSCYAMSKYPDDEEARKVFAKEFLNSCLYEAWLIISVRKGFTKEGIFIKD